MMTTRIRCSFLCSLLLLLDAPNLHAAEPTRANLAVFTGYTQALETRLAAQHRSPGSFLAPALAPDAAARLQRGELLIDRLDTPSTADLHSALLHHWRGTAFIPGATATGFERLLRDFNSYPQHFTPQITAAHLESGDGPHFIASMRVRQRHVITVVLDSTFDVTFGQLDARHGYSLSESTRISEIEAAGTPGERALSPKDDHGFLWRLNTYWSWEERDGGLYVQLESVTLTRSIPTGLAWAVKPYTETIPRESLEFTLRSAATALQNCH